MTLRAKVVTSSMEKDSYSRAEVLAAVDGLPQRGPFCEVCNARIPVFEDLSEADEQLVRQCIRERQYITAIGKLRLATGCSILWARVWVDHTAKEYPKETAPCPYCGMPLRTPIAKQCRFCGRDWHDENNIVQL